MSILLRVVMLALIAWGLWRIYIALYPPAPRRPKHIDTPDEWQDVLEAIDELPETAEPHRRARKHDARLPTVSEQPVGSGASEAIESVMVEEAETALSLVREGDENERLAAYHEIAVYEKLCAIADGHISKATRQRIDDIHQQALELICPPDEEY
ncbi:MAG: hypothetical protein ETSY1_11650 [Candidatus Entotheonella factor]|uniref:Uncharacterized protein n=1 Tax=Entotheonella factor TaxID=1429438 RepID=W4LRI7_ENTF1|nr:MAG: hypothetical protein ETSY1_11650 [Candidatus Entotheonella factor]